MKLDRFNGESINERSMYFTSDKKEQSEDDKKFEIIERLSKHWNEKLKNDYLVPRSLYKYSLDELVKIEDYYLNDNINENIDYDKVASIIKEKGWGDIIHTTNIEEFENSDYFRNNRLISCMKPGSESQYAEELHQYMSGKQSGVIQEVLKELQQLHSTNEAVETIRIEGNEIVFDCKCETDIQGTTEYNGISLRFNKLCDIRESKYYNQDKIDNILDKIIDEGFSSLTDIEIKILEVESKGDDRIDDIIRLLTELSNKCKYLKYNKIHDEELEKCSTEMIRYENMLKKIYGLDRNDYKLKNENVYFDDELTEVEIIAHARLIKEQCINEYLNEIKKL